MSGILYPPIQPSTGTAWADITGTPTTLSGYGITDAAAKTQTDFWSWYVPTVSNGDMLLILRIPSSHTINSLTTKSCAGTCTLTGTIDGVALGGGSNSVSTTQQVVSHSTNNIMSALQDFGVTLASNSSCKGLSLTANVTAHLS